MVRNVCMILQETARVEQRKKEVLALSAIKLDNSGVR